MALDGIFITTELEVDLAKRIHAHQVEFDPKMANFLPPHVTLIGSSGAGPIPSDTPLAELKARILPVAEATEPISLRFGPPERFVQREIVSLPLDPHGPIRTLHERLRAWFPRGPGYDLAEPMAVESKPLFHPEIIRRSVRAFTLPQMPSLAVSRLRYWAELIASGRADTFKETALLPEFLTDILAGRLGWRSSNGHSYSSSVNVAPFHD